MLINCKTFRAQAIPNVIHTLRSPHRHKTIYVFEIVAFVYFQAGIVYYSFGGARI